MKYALFGNTGCRVSRLGFGSMRFPMLKDGDREVVDTAQSIKMLRYTIDNGVNYGNL